jgi:hypothetical protein
MTGATQKLYDFVSVKLNRTGGSEEAFAPQGG